MSKTEVSSKIICQHCNSDQTFKSGFSQHKKQRYYCRSCRRGYYFTPGQKGASRNLPKAAPPSASRLALELQAIAQRIGRNPTIIDIKKLSREGRAFSIHTYYQVFDNFSKALQKARLTAPIDPGLEKKILMGELRDLHAKIKRPLIRRDVVAARKKGKVSTIYKFEKIFGSVAKALAAAGVGRKIKYSREELIEILRRIDAAQNHPVAKSDIKRWHKSGRSPSHRTFEKKFGGIVKARLAAGVLNVYRKDRGATKNWQKYTLEELIRQLQALGEKLGRKPTNRDINQASKQGQCASGDAFRRAFGSLTNAYRKAGFEKVRPRTYTDREILAALRKMVRQKGAMPTYREISDASKAGICPSTHTIVKRLGKLSKLKEDFNL